MDNMTKVQPRVTLRTVAEHVGLTPGTISAVLNNTRAADRIPQHTRDRVIAAARQLNYSPNPLARALRAGRSVTAGMHSADTGSVRGALVIMHGDQFERALNAIQQAGLRVPDDVSVVDLFDSPTAWEHPSFNSAPEYPRYEEASLS
jgi:DNA-binding LacI/PurR family transcriptional regulator